MHNKLAHLQCVPRKGFEDQLTVTHYIYVSSIYPSVVYTTADPNFFRGTHYRKQKTKRYFFLTLIVVICAWF